MSVIGEKLKALRLRAGLSMEEAAKALGFARASSYQYYESPTGYDRDRLPAHMIDKLRAAFVGKGSPPIFDADIDELADGSAEAFTPKPVPLVGAEVTLVGAHADAVLMLLKQSYGVEFTRLPVYSSASEADTRLALARRKPKRSTLLSAVNVAALGDPATMAVVVVEADNMKPTIRPEGFVIIDTTHDHVVADGIYALAIGGCLSFRRCQHDAATGLLNLSSDNPAYPATESVHPQSVSVAGRAVWVAQRL